MNNRKGRVCPVEIAGTLDNRIRRWVQNPWKILGPYVKSGMTVLDYGCGPGFFSLDMAEMVGGSGKVIAADLQAGMLDIVRKKIRGTILENRIALHKCREDAIGVAEKLDFVLAFYMLHELPDQGAFFREIVSILKPEGKILAVEPPFHVSKWAFSTSIDKAQDAGLVPLENPKVFLSKAVVLGLKQEDSSGQRKKVGRTLRPSVVLII